MGYYIDLKTISIDKYKHMLKTSQLIPSWKILEENMDENFELLKKNNINNLEQLVNTLKDKDKIYKFSQENKIPQDYLIVLKRVATGYKQKPNKIQDFPCINKDTILELEKIGIKNTAKLYEKVLSKKDREKLSQETKINENEIIKLTYLSDLSRIRWVNHTFAYVLLEAGYNSAQEIAQEDHIALYEKVKELNEKRKLFNAHIGVRDMKMCIESAQYLDFEIEY